MLTNTSKTEAAEKSGNAFYSVVVIQKVHAEEEMNCMQFCALYKSASFIIKVTVTQGDTDSFFYCKLDDIVLWARKKQLQTAMTRQLLCRCKGFIPGSLNLTGFDVAKFVQQHRVVVMSIWVLGDSSLNPFCTGRCIK